MVPLRCDSKPHSAMSQELVGMASGIEFQKKSFKRSHAELRES